MITLASAIVIFASVVFLHLAKKNAFAVFLYCAESLALTLLYALAALNNPNPLLWTALFATAFVKVAIAPYFLLRLIREHELRFLNTTYLSTPLTLLCLAALVALTQTPFLSPLDALAPAHEGLLRLSIAVILISIFLLINRKGALSQMLGILSTENGIVAFALFAGLEQSPSLELGIAFDIMLWVFIAGAFLSMIYRHYGSLDVTAMRKLAE